MEEKATITLSLNAKYKETSVEDVIGIRGPIMKLE